MSKMESHSERRVSIAFKAPPAPPASFGESAAAAADAEEVDWRELRGGMTMLLQSQLAAGRILAPEPRAH
jgi:hypothetical protein